MKDLFNCQKEENRERCREAPSAIWPFEDAPQVLVDVFALATRPGLGGAGRCWGGGFLILCVLFWCVFPATDALHLRYPTKHISLWFNEVGTIKPVSSFPLLCFPEKKFYFTLIISAKVMENNTFLCGLRESSFYVFCSFFQWFERVWPFPQPIFFAKRSLDQHFRATLRAEKPQKAEQLEKEVKHTQTQINVRVFINTG